MLVVVVRSLALVMAAAVLLLCCTAQRTNKAHTNNGKVVLLKQCKADLDIYESGGVFIIGVLGRTLLNIHLPADYLCIFQ